MLEFMSYRQRNQAGREVSPIEPGDESIFTLTTSPNGRFDARRIPAARKILGDKKVDYLLAQKKRADESAASVESKPKGPPAEFAPSLPRLTPEQIEREKRTPKSAPAPIQPQLKKLSLADKLAEIGLDPDTVRKINSAPPAERPVSSGAKTHPSGKGITPQSPAAHSVPKWIAELVNGDLPPRAAFVTADSNHAAGTALISKILERALGRDPSDRDIFDRTAVLQSVAADLNRISGALSEPKLNLMKVAEPVAEIERALRSPHLTRNLIIKFLELIRSGRIGWSGTAGARKSRS